jgi:hypothetical protein
MRNVTYLLVGLSLYAGFYMKDYPVGLLLTLMALGHHYYVENYSSNKLS